MDRIEVSDLQIDCVVGVLEREQRATQRIVVDLTLELDLEACGESGDLAQGLDYAAVAEQVRMLAEHGRFRLLESLALAACRLLLAPPAPGEARAAVQHVDLRIRKPEILAGLCVPAVRMRRPASWCQLEERGGDGVVEQRLVRVTECGVSRVLLSPGSGFTPGDRALLVLGGALRQGSRVVGPMERVARGSGPVQADGPAVLLAVGT